MPFIDSVSPLKVTPLGTTKSRFKWGVTLANEYDSSESVSFPKWWNCIQHILQWQEKVFDHMATLPGIRVTRYDCRDALRGGDLAGVDHDEHLHEVVVQLAAAGLHDVDVLAAHGLADLHTDEGEREDGHPEYNQYGL